MKAATALIMAFATALFAQQPVPSANNSQRLTISGVARVFAAISASTATFAQESEKGTLRWSFETQGVIESPAVAADGTIYVASTDTNLYALSPEGKRKWVFKTGGPIDSSPAIAADGTIYVGSYDNNLYAITPEGKQKWTFTGGFRFSTPALAADGTIYANNRDRKIYALTPEGKLKWSVQIKCDFFPADSSAAVGADGTVYVGGCDNQLHAFTPEGKSQWASAVAGDPHVSSPALGADGTIYVANKSQPGFLTLYAFTPQGKLKWSFETPSGSMANPPVIALDGTIYYATEWLYALTPEGKRKWEFHEGEDSSPPAIGADGTIYRTAGGNALYAITPEGTLKWSLKTGSRLSCSPVIGADGTVYAGTSLYAENKKNALFAFRVSSRGYAAGPWPSNQARWMKHGGGQPAVEQAPAPAVAELRRIPAPSSESGSRPVEQKIHPELPFLKDLETLGVPEGGELVFDGAKQHNTSSPDSGDACSMCAFTMATFLSNARLEDPWHLRLRIYYYKKSPAEIEAFYSARIPGFRFIEEKQKEQDTPRSGDKRDRSYDQFVYIESGNMKPVSNSSELPDFTGAKDGINILLLDINDHPHLKRKLAPGEHICYLILTNLRK